MGYPDFFRDMVADEYPPLPYQGRLAEQEWPDALVVPTGLGKTAAVIGAWLYRRTSRPAETPRRLIYCLPMRSLVEQTVAEATAWAAALRATHQLKEEVAVVTLVGGNVAGDWNRDALRSTVIIGTQDLLVSRALMRGYAMSRYQWPVDFALLHNDALWVFDEVQLMGAAVATSAQLQAFRDGLGVARPARTLWVSATFSPAWLETVDFRVRPQTRPFRVLGLDAEDRATAVVQQRENAEKALKRADLTLASLKKKDLEGYLDALAGLVVGHHRAGTTTLVILNRVDRAQELFRRLRRQRPPAAADLLIHSRFRPQDKEHLRAQLKNEGETDRIVVATQAIEAGIDLTSTTLITELAPWTSLVQRCGRCNRRGEDPGARVIWLDAAVDGPVREAGDIARPYAPEDLRTARRLLAGLTSASPATLTAAADAATLAGLDPSRSSVVLRRKDLLDFFNTEPDLSGFDTDVAPFVRDADDSDLALFWRDLGLAAGNREPGENEPAPTRDELCPVPIARVRELIERHKNHPHKNRLFWVADPLAGERKTKGGQRLVRWVRLERDQLRPGLEVMVDTSAGGYHPALGFLPSADQPVARVPSPDGPPPERVDDDPASTAGRTVGLREHLDDAAAAARALLKALDIPADKPDGQAVVTAAGWHDVGKAHEVFQDSLRRAADPGAPDTLLAKAGGKKRLRHQRPRFRHELASALAWLAHHRDAPGRDAPDRDLVAYLIAAHHGKVRLALRALPGEQEPDTPNALYARGIWSGDTLPAIDGVMSATTLTLDVMQLGIGDHGPSWTERTQRLLERHGPFRLAWLETLVRLADWQASAEYGDGATPASPDSADGDNGHG